MIDHQFITLGVKNFNFLYWVEYWFVSPYNMMYICVIDTQ